MKKNYKYLMILTFILNFTNIYSQSNNYIYTWYNESIGTLYIDKQLLESSASMLSQYFSTLSQYLGPLEPIILKILPYVIENLPILVSFFALFFMSRRFINILNSELPESEKHMAALLMSLPLTFFFWPFVIPILIIAFIIKVFRIGKSKLESLRETLGKIDPRLKSIFSRATSDIKNFNKDTDKILKDINKLHKIIIYSYIISLLNSIERYIETLKNIMSQLKKEAENEELTIDKLKNYSSQFDTTYNATKTKIEDLNRTINNIFGNYSFLRRFGNKIFRTNRFTPKYLMELRNIIKDLNERLNAAYNEGRETFAHFNGLLALAEAINMKYAAQINTELKTDANVLSYLGNQGKPIVRKIQMTETIVAATSRNRNISPLKTAEKLFKVRNSIKKLSKILRKFRGNPKKLLYFAAKYSKVTTNITIKTLIGIIKILKIR
jgi:methyl-accepting chemotaxis protein